MTAEATLSHRLRKMLAENIGLKLFSLVVSIALFGIMHGSEAGQRSLYVPVVVLLPSEESNKVLVDEVPDKVKVTLSGSRSVINSIDRVDAVQVDLRDARPYYSFEPEAFGLPAGIKVEVNPARLALKWESRLEQKVLVRAQLVGSPDPALELVGKVSITPGKVLISGPRSKVEALREVPTEAISLSDLGPGTHRRKVALLPFPKLVTSDDGIEVEVELTLDTRKEQRRLRKVPVAALGVNVPVLVRPQHVDVVISAPESTLAELDPEHVVPVVDLTGMNMGNGPVSVPVKLRGIDDTVRVVRIEPSEALVRAK
jgi:YbbR domain-containing protein